MRATRHRTIMMVSYGILGVGPGIFVWGVLAVRVRVERVHSRRARTVRFRIVPFGDAGLPFRWVVAEGGGCLGVKLRLVSPAG